MTYLLDSNVFIQAKNLHYGFDFCPAFWDWVVKRNAAKSVFSIEKVGDEIAAGADTLAQYFLAGCRLLSRRPRTCARPYGRDTRSRAGLGQEGKDP